MAIKSFKPYSAGRRFMTVSTFEDITTSKPEKSLLAKLTNKGGRNNSGKMTVRHQGGGHKRRYRIIDFKRIKDNIPAKVASSFRRIASGSCKLPRYNRCGQQPGS